MDVGNVGIDVADDVSLQLIDGFPQILAFATFVAHFRKNVGGKVNIRAVSGGHLSRTVVRAGIDDCKLVDQSVSFH